MSSSDPFGELAKEAGRLRGEAGRYRESQRGDAMSTKCAFFDRFCDVNCTAWRIDSYPTHCVRLDVEYNNSERKRLGWDKPEAVQ